MLGKEPDEKALRLKSMRRYDPMRHPVSDLSYVGNRRLWEHTITFPTLLVRSQQVSS